MLKKFFLIQDESPAFCSLLIYYSIITLSPAHWQVTQYQGSPVTIINILKKKEEIYVDINTLSQQSHLKSILENQLLHFI